MRIRRLLIVEMRGRRAFHAMKPAMRARRFQVGISWPGTLNDSGLSVRQPGYSISPMKSNTSTRIAPPRNVVHGSVGGACAAILKAFRLRPRCCAASPVERTGLDKEQFFACSKLWLKPASSTGRKQGYRSRLQPVRTRKFRIGYARKATCFPSLGSSRTAC